MVFHAIGVWLLVAAVPLWIYRWYVYSRLDARERRVFTRIVKRRHENAYAFALQMFGFLIALATAVILLVLGLRYIKQGSLELGAYRETIRNRLYSGVDPIDRALDAYHYDQFLPVAILTTCALLSVAFTLVATALRDISMMSRLNKKLQGMKERQTQAAAN
ncbi:MAG: hypothetical protein RIE06_12740 [Roseibium album]|uniref:Uncharacterized protein n=1 Tax=Roseibium album TaxID=311410 RepID=A0A0M7AST6_9HYPH|nr:hypothetical protein [Roseibium album]MBG6146424.1 hypothetical protein [Labrenzia sp. EL_142]MBG6164910.1 hypothetical protein [Labrenzia sp. EL_195]MBG6173399.1 hypothetical protein [Labrenzia sp. EL_132]MBG6202334.1 hypothetical protein [Labrenzia sp. EL_13]MBG6227831.1 hypothetical protein [Labrenzia sp. EL_208]